MKLGFEFVDNAGPNTVATTLAKLCRGAREVDIVSAFATSAGVHELLPALGGVAIRGRVRICVGLYRGVTEPKALRALLRFSEEHPGRVTVNVASNPRLHRKVYLVRSRSRIALLAGSSNLTREGFQSEGESNVLLSLPDTAEMRRQIRGSVPEWSRRDAVVPLSALLIEGYAELRAGDPGRAIQDRALLRLLGSTRAPRKSVPPRASTPRRVAHSMRWFRDYTNGYAASATAAVVEQSTSWSRRGWDWMTAPAHRFRTGDHLALFELHERWARIVSVKDVVRTAVATPDGRHFVAYKVLAGYRRRRLTRAFWRELAAAGLPIARAQRDSTRELTVTGKDAVESVFKRRP